MNKRWVGFAELSLEREPAKRVMIYYAYPAGSPRYGFFSSTSKDRQAEFLASRMTLHPDILAEIERLLV